jgi:predicted SnoaL-like aldol condensation-catalyzing enzyme
METKNFKVQTYLDDGRVFEYEVNSEEKVREHASAIVKDGYRHNDGKIFEHYPPHRILKVKSEGITTMYPDIVRGT